MVSQVFLLSTSALKLPDLAHQLCHSIAFLTKTPSAGHSVSVTEEAGGTAASLHRCVL